MTVDVEWRRWDTLETTFVNTLTCHSSPPFALHSDTPRQENCHDGCIWDSYGAMKLGCFCATRLLDEQWFLLVVFLFNSWGIHRRSFSQCDKGDISGSLFSSDFVGFRLSSNNLSYKNWCIFAQPVKNLGDFGKWKIQDSRLLYCLARETEFVSKHNYEIHTKQIWHITVFKPKELLLLTHNGIN